MAIDKVKIEQIMKAQLDETGWNFYHERQHVENLFYSRFNFFLVLYGMFVAAIVTLQSDLECKIDSCVIIALVFFAIIILSLVWATLCRNYQTLGMILYILDKGLPAYHSSPYLSEYMEGNSKIWHSRDLMATCIPACCLLSLYIYLWYICDVSDVLIPDLFKIIGWFLIGVLLILNIILVYKVYACDYKEYFNAQDIKSKFEAYQKEKNRIIYDSLHRIFVP